MRLVVGKREKVEKEVQSFLWSEKKNEFKLHLTSLTLNEKQRLIHIY